MGKKPDRLVGITPMSQSANNASVQLLYPPVTGANNRHITVDNHVLRITTTSGTAVNEASGGKMLSTG